MEQVMKTGTRGIQLIKDFEGFRSKPYYCSAKKLTIGYGHVILPNEAFPEEGISQGEATELLKKDLVKAESAVLKLIKVNLTQEQFDALVSFTFNLGAGTLQRSTVRIALNEGDVIKAMSYWKKYIYAAGKPLIGLQRRRLAEIELFMSTTRIEDDGSF